MRKSHVSLARVSRLVDGHLVVPILRSYAIAQLVLRDACVRTVRSSIDHERDETCLLDDFSLFPVESPFCCSKYYSKCTQCIGIANNADLPESVPAVSNAGSQSKNERVLSLVNAVDQRLTSVNSIMKNT